MSFWEQLALPYNGPYAIAIGLVAVQLVVQLAGFGLGELAGADAGVDGAPTTLLDGVLTALHARNLPASLVATVMCLAFGFVGLALTAVGRDQGWDATQLWGAVPLSVVAAIAFTRGFAAVCRRIVPPGCPPVPDAAALVGARGRASNGPVDHRPSQLVVATPSGQERLVAGVMAPGEPPAPRGAEVELIAFDERRQLFHCRQPASRP